MNDGTNLGRLLNAGLLGMSLAKQQHIILCLFKLVNTIVYWAESGFGINAHNVISVCLTIKLKRKRAYHCKNVPFSIKEKIASIC